VFFDFGVDFRSCRGEPSVCHDLFGVVGFEESSPGCYYVVGSGASCWELCGRDGGQREGRGTYGH